MIVLSECELCRLGVLTRVPLCYGKGNPLLCVFTRMFRNLLRGGCL